MDMGFLIEGIETFGNLVVYSIVVMVVHPVTILKILNVHFKDTFYGI